MIGTLALFVSGDTYYSPFSWLLIQRGKKMFRGAAAPAFSLWENSISQGGLNKLLQSFDPDTVVIF